MRKILLGVWLGVWLGLCVIPGFAATEKSVQPVQVRKPVPDSRQLEKELQSLNWKQFKLVVEAIPPIKAEVDKYGPLGWQYVQQRYRTYAWRGVIDRLEVAQKRELDRLIARARKTV